MSRLWRRSVVILVLLNVLLQIKAEDAVNSIAEDRVFHINLDVGDEPVKPMPVAAVIREMLYEGPSKKASEDLKKDEETSGSNFNESLSRNKRQTNFGGKSIINNYATSLLMSMYNNECLIK